MPVKLFLTCLLLGAALQAAPLAENGFIVIGDRGRDAVPSKLAQGQATEPKLVLRFSLNAPTAVWAEARGVRGLDAQRPEAAPEAFLDDVYLGPLRAEHGGRWRSPKAVTLDAGEHVFELRAAAVRDADDVRIDRVLVLSESEAGAAAKPAPSAAACKGLRWVQAWPSNLHGRAKTLSVLSGREVSSGELVRLDPGQRWRAQLRIPYDQTGHALPLLAQVLAGKDAVKLLLFFDHSVPKGATNESVGYRPGVWQDLKLSHCGGELHIGLAQLPEISVKSQPSGVGFEVAARDLELSLRPPR